MTNIELPRIQRSGDGFTLIVDGEPTVLLGGQLHNSTSSSSDHVADALLLARDLHCNMVIAPTYWELLEPAEGSFDFGHVDTLLAEARSQELRLVLLWFGSFKNAASTYAPRWVRADHVRFPRAERSATGVQGAFSPGANPAPVLSVFSPSLRDADARAFAALMQHLAEVDQQHTVIMVQVENESGLLHDARDRCDLAEAAWAETVPLPLIEQIASGASDLRPELRALWERQGCRRTGTWSQVFGSDWQAEEVFMAWHFAAFAEHLTQAGKAQKQLPMYANAWLGPQPGMEQAGAWPSGGPATRVLDVWKAAAPSLDLLAPDIYIDDAAGVCHIYHRDDNPLFIPESRYVTGTMFLAVGEHRALGFSVFGLDDAARGNQLSSAYALLAPYAGELARAQADGRVHGVVLDPGEAERAVDFGNVQITAVDTRELLSKAFIDAGVNVRLESPAPTPETDGGHMPAFSDTRSIALLVQVAADEFIVVGKGLSFRFVMDGTALELDRVEEGSMAAGSWSRGRVLNGDERLHVLPMDEIGMTRVRVLLP